MSSKQNDVYIENLIEERERLLNLWNGSDDGFEDKINDIEAELLDLGIDLSKRGI